MKFCYNKLSSETQPMLLPLLFSLAATLQFHAKAVALPGSSCPEKCGDIDIDYPFGIGTNCAREGFKLNCNKTEDGRSNMTFFRNMHVLNISLQKGQVRMMKYISYMCYNQSSKKVEPITATLNLEGIPFTFASKENSFTVIGVNTLAYMFGSTYVTGCLSQCSPHDNLRVTAQDGLCTGAGCCQSLLAVVIRNLKLVKGDSNVIIIDANGSRSKAIARLLKKLGVKRPYLVKGGFQSWAKNLRVKELKPETALTVINEDAEEILEGIKPTPTLVLGSLLGLPAAAYALLEWETTLQYIGVLSLGLTIYLRFSTYEGSEDLQKALQLLLSPVRVGAQAFSWAAKKLEPSKVGLATSPSTTAVQDRVLQAAAKHQSQPSDAEADSLVSEA